LNHGAKVTLPAFGKKTGEEITAEFEIFAYNGGLFLPDEVLDNVKIDDTVLHTYSEKLSHYDFDSDVDVNILGHIFENSLNEIDEIKSEIEGETVDKTKTKRKKDGVFYTPKYITKYIVDNTVGKLCEEKKAEIKLNDEDYINDKKLQTKTKKALLDKLGDYRNWLLELTICDPACGSGAFLNQALEFLIAEHRYIDELQAKLMGDAMILSDVETSILENNIYGVDLNDESVEIAKLSLWLRTAQKGRKLNSLNNNIKCGNSLIDDPSVAGDKAFSWEKEFPEVFSKGGFDVVIGNPPYVRHESIKEYKPAFQARFESFLGTADLYVYFIELGVFLLKTQGKLGFINPNKFIKASYGKNIKQFLSQHQIEQLIDFGELNVFQDAVTSPLILIVSKTKTNHQAKYVQIKTLVNLDLNDKIQSDFIEIAPHSFQKEEWNLISTAEVSIINKVSGAGTNIAKNTELDIKRGLLTGLNEAFLIDEDKMHDLIKDHAKSGNLIKKFIDGDDVRKYEIRNKGKYLICIPSGFTNSFGIFNSEEDAWLWMRDNFPGIMNHLETYKDKAIKRTDKGNYWWELRACDYYNLIESPKILYPEIAMSSRFALGESDLSQSTSTLNELYNQVNALNTNFLNFLLSQIGLLSSPKKMQKWHELKFSEFIIELNKGIKTANRTPLTKLEEMEWMEVFEAKKKNILELKAEIEKTEKVIDQLVYTLYGLTDEEIKIVEGA
jgi:type I restriction-modification system DNA methylase subunit